MRISHIVLLILLSNVVIAKNNNTIVTGKVFDKITKEPLIGVNIIYGDNKGTITDENGNFLIEYHQKELTLIFKYIGYSTENISLNAIDKDTILLEIGLTEIINELDEIVISANKSEQKVSELTVSLDIIKPEVVTNNHTLNAADIITYTPGIEILDDQASIRGGSGYSYGAGSRVLVLIDGLPALSADAGDVKWNFLPVENLSQIEIIKGASSVLYGSSALNGIINFRTRDIAPKPYTKLSIISGIYDKPRNNKWIWSDKPQTFNDISFYHSRKYKNNEFGIGSNVLLDEGYRKYDDEYSGRLNVNIKHNSKKYMAMTYGVNCNTTFTQHQDFILWENADSGALIQNKQSAMKLNSFILTVDPYVIIDPGEKSDHEFKMRYQTTQNKFHVNTENNSDAYSYFTEYKYWKKVFEKMNLTSGISQQFVKVNSNFYKNHTGYNVAVYSQFDYHPVEKLSFIAGIRLEQYSLDSEFDELKPIFRTGLNYRLADFTFLRASFGQGYRYPSIAEKYGNTTVGSIRIFPNPEVKSESGWSAEIGLKQGINFLGINGQVDVAMFNSQNTNLIEYIFGLYPEPGTQINAFGFKATNIENSRVFGYEIELMVNMYINELQINLSNGYTYIYPVEYNLITNKTSEEFLKYRNKHTNKTKIDFKLKKFDLGFLLRYKSKMLRIDDVFLNRFTREGLLPGFYDYWQKNNTSSFIIDQNARYNINNKSSISLSVKNIFNVEYIGRPGDILPQRSFSFQYAYDF